MLDLCVGDIVRHLKRGSRYRIDMRVRAPAWLLDDERYIMCLSEQDQAHGRPWSFLLPDSPNSGDSDATWAFRRFVMVQNSVTFENGEVEVDWLLYASLENPDWVFLRPAREFTPERFLQEMPTAPQSAIPQ